MPTSPPTTTPPTVPGLTDVLEITVVVLKTLLLLLLAGAEEDEIDVEVWVLDSGRVDSLPGVTR